MAAVVLRYSAGCLVVAISFAAACHRHDDTKTRSRPMASAIPKPPPSTNELAPPAKAESDDSLCTRLRAGLSFLECMNPPRTTDYPDCRTFSYDLHEGACPGAELELNITGYPGLSEQLLVSAEPDPGAHAIELRYVRHLSQTREAQIAAATAIARLELRPGEPAKMLVHKGLRAYTRARSIVEQLSDPPVSPRDASPPCSCETLDEIEHASRRLFLARCFGGQNHEEGFAVCSSKKERVASVSLHIGESTSLRLRWVGDSRRVVATWSAGSGVALGAVFEAEGSKVLELYGTDIDVSPDSRFAAVFGPHDGAPLRLMVYDLETGTVLHDRRDCAPTTHAVWKNNVVELDCAGSSKLQLAKERAR